MDITHDNVFFCMQSTYFSIVPLSLFTELPISSFLFDSGQPIGNTVYQFKADRQEFENKNNKVAEWE